LKNIEYTGKYYFLNALESAIGKEQTEHYKLLILEYTQLISNKVLRERRDNADIPVTVDALVNFCEMFPQLCQKAAEPGKDICNYSPKTCQSVNEYIEKNKGTFELLKIALHTATDIISIGQDLALCLTTLTGDPLGIIGCLSLVCDVISLNNHLSNLVTELNKRCISEIPLYVFYPIPISVPLPECVPIQIPDISPIEINPCICAFVSLASFGKDPSFASGVGSMSGLSECMCLAGGVGDGGGGGGILRPRIGRIYNDIEIPCIPITSSGQ